MLTSVRDEKGLVAAPPADHVARMHRVIMGINNNNKIIIMLEFPCARYTCIIFIQHIHVWSSHCLTVLLSERIAWRWADGDRLCLHCFHQSPLSAEPLQAGRLMGIHTLLADLCVLTHTRERKLMRVSNTPLEESLSG